MLLAVFADRNLSPLRHRAFFTLILLSFIEPHYKHNALVCSRDFDRKELQSLLFFRFGLPRRWKDKKKLSEDQFKALFHFLNRQDTFLCLAIGWIGDEETLIYHTAVLVARKVKILPSNPLVVVVSPLNALISDQRESCQRLKLKAVEMERELFDNDDALKELKNAEVLYCSGKHPIQVVHFKDGQSIDWNCCGAITLRSELD